MQVFRLVQTGVVDKVIAFDELPKRLLKDVEMRRPDGLPRHWKTFIGNHERVILPMNEKNPATGKVEKIGGGTEIAPFFYVLYFKEINRDIQRWQDISAFVRRVVELKFRLMDKLEDMALPMSTDANSEIKLEPEHLEEQGAIIPIPEEFQEKGAKILDGNGNEVPVPPPDDTTLFKCKECGKSFMNERGLEIHMHRMHKKEKVSA